MSYGYISDKAEVRGFISKETILEVFDEEDIFSLVFGFRPVINTYVCSPFRKDTNPSCWFSLSPSGQLRFVDFANNNIMYGIRMFNMDCFNAVQVFFRLPNFYQALRFIKKSLAHVRKSSRNIIRPKKLLKKTEMFFSGRNFVAKDAEFWSSYGISKNNLIEDNVFPVSRILMKNTKTGDIDTRLKETCYALTGFEERLKFYFPFRSGSKRFLTNCTQNDIGSVSQLMPYGRQLIITKSYKDRRVIANIGRQSVWNQNEGMEPEDKYLLPLVKRFDKVIVLYDNDRQGIASATKLSKRINAEFPLKARPLWIPEHLKDKGLTDPADLRRKSETELHEFFRSNFI